MLLVTRAPLHLILGAKASRWGIPLESLELENNATLMATIGYYTYVLITPGLAKGIRILAPNHSKVFELLSCEQSESDPIFSVSRAAICYLNLCDGITITLISELPSHAGLSMLNAAATALIKGLAFWSGLDLGAAEVADLAGNIEIPKHEHGINKLDTYAISLGGLNLVRQMRHRIIAEPFPLNAPIQANLEASLMLFIAPPSLTANSVRLPTSKVYPKYPANELRQLNTHIQVALMQGDLEAYGRLLHRTWPAQQNSLSTMTLLERGYWLSRSLGAWGGTLSENADGSGSLMLVCPPQYQEEVRAALTHLGLDYWPVTLVSTGVEIFQTLPWPTAQTWQELYVNRQQGVIFQ